MNHVNTSDWYNSLKQELESKSLSIEKVSRRSEYWRKSNLDIASDFIQDTSQIDLSQLKGTCLFEPDLTIHGDIMKLESKNNGLVLSIMDVIADEESFAKNYFGRLEEKSQKREITTPTGKSNRTESAIFSRAIKLSRAPYREYRSFGLRNDELLKKSLI